MASNRYTVVSLFSGGMGLDLGLERTSRFRLLACVEKVPAFAETIRINRDAGRLNNPNVLIYGGHEDGDASKLDPARVMTDLDIKPGELDLLVGGPPCQTFSTTGRRASVQDPRGTLLWQYLKFVAALQPKFFLMENVRGLMSAALRHRPSAKRPEKGGLPYEPDEEPGSVIRRFVHDLNDDYRVDCFEVNAVNYGTPQLRERVLFIGNRLNRVVEFPEPTHGSLGDLEQAKHDVLNLFSPGQPPLHPFKTLREALTGLNDPDPVILDFSPRKKTFLARIPEGGNWRCLPPEIAKESMGKEYYIKGGRSGWWRRLTFDLPCPTVLTMPNHAGTALCHPTETRALSLKECARIQEFPDDWTFSGTVSEQYAQVGNAVPVRLGEVAGDLLARELDDAQMHGFQSATGTHPVCRVVYMKSHIRTRQWFKAGQKCVWQDGEDNGDTVYRAAKQIRKVGTVQGQGQGAV